MDVFAWFKEKFGKPKDKSDQPQGSIFPQQQQVIPMPPQAPPVVGGAFQTYQFDVLEKIKEVLWTAFRGEKIIKELDKNGIPRERRIQVSKPILTPEGIEEIMNILRGFAGAHVPFSNLSLRLILYNLRTVNDLISKLLYEQRERVFEKEYWDKPVYLNIVACTTCFIVESVISRALGGQELLLWYNRLPVQFEIPEPEVV